MPTCSLSYTALHSRKLRLVHDGRSSYVVPNTMSGRKEHTSGEASTPSKSTHTAMFALVTRRHVQHYFNHSHCHFSESDDSWIF